MLFRSGGKDLEFMAGGYGWVEEGAGWERWESHKKTNLNLDRKNRVAVRWTLKSMEMTALIRIRELAE